MKVYTEADVREWVAGNLDGIMKAFHESTDVPDWAKKLPKMEAVWQAGCWLKATLLELGAAAEEASDICFCHGQRSAFGDPWRWAVNYANEFAARECVRDRPGDELADRINRETFARSDASGGQT